MSHPYISPLGVSFKYEHLGQEVICRVTREALIGVEGSHPTTNSDLADLFEKYKQLIFQTAASKIAMDDVEADGKVCIRDIDLKSFKKIDY